MDHTIGRIGCAVAALLAAAILGGCQPAATANRAGAPAYRAEVQVAPVTGSSEYLVDTRILEGEGASAMCISAPRMLVAEGRLGTVTVGSQDGADFTGIRVDVVVKRQGAAVEALVETKVLDKGKVTWSDTKTVPVTPAAKS